MMTHQLGQTVLETSGPSEDTKRNRRRSCWPWLYNTLVSPRSWGWARALVPSFHAGMDATGREQAGCSGAPEDVCLPGQPWALCTGARTPVPFQELRWASSCRPARSWIVPPSSALRLPTSVAAPIVHAESQRPTSFHQPKGRLCATLRKFPQLVQDAHLCRTSLIFWNILGIQKR